MDYNDIRTNSLRHLYLDSQWEKIDFIDSLKLQIDKLKDIPFIRIGVWEYDRFIEDYHYRPVSYHRVSKTGRILAGIEDYTSILNYLRDLSLILKEADYETKRKY